MSEYKKPLPVVDGDSREYWEGCRQHKLLIQQCEDCQKYIFYPRNLCPHCHSDRIKWVESSGRGKVYSYTINRRPAFPSFAEETPYVVALIELEEGVRMISNIINCDIDQVKIDMPVEVVFEKATEEITLPKFQPVVD